MASLGLEADYMHAKVTPSWGRDDDARIEPTAPPCFDDLGMVPDLDFWRGLAFALPVSIALWVGLIWVIRQLLG